MLWDFLKVGTVDFNGGLVEKRKISFRIADDNPVPGMLKYRFLKLFLSGKLSLGLFKRSDIKKIPDSAEILLLL